MESVSLEKLNSVDYIEVYSQAVLEMEFDFVKTIIYFLVPEFIHQDEFLFLKACFSEEKYKYKKNYCNNDEVQFWMNAVELTGLFGMNYTNSLQFGERLVEEWNKKLKIENYELYEAKLFPDIDYEEVIISIIGRKDV